MTRAVVFILTLVICVGCLSHVIQSRDGQDYEISTRRVFGVEVSRSEGPAKTSTQEAREDAAGTYRHIGAACAVGAILAFLVAYLTSVRESAGAGVVLAASSLVCMWLSIAGLSWWVMGIGAAVCIVALVLHFKLIDFDLIKAIKNRKGRIDG